MSNDTDAIRELGTRIVDLLFEAVRLQAVARESGDSAAVERIAAFIAGVSAAESACLRTDESAGAFLLSRLDEHRVH
ncbi:hypothetical protein [Roseospira goensis]|uniref:Uncharacterized protein n=1 Tax=Roseospira goensis TaxID=391922 RepID=A0A7W6WK70_9PROT|nr:hypothetical protein [Roseospira goensis]MBB4285825.1 hypothetical protein [Roseospira goensis]